MTIDASAVTDDGPAPRIEWDVPDALDASTSADGHVLTATWDHPGLQDVGVYVTDSDGNLARGDRARHRHEPPAGGADHRAEHRRRRRARSLLTAGDADRRPVARYRWDLDGAPGFELDTGANAWATTTFAAAGAHTVGVQLTDSGRRGRRGARDDRRQRAAADQPDGDVVDGEAVTRSAPRLLARHAAGLRRGPVLLLVRSSAAGRLALRVGTRRDGARPLLRRTVVLRARRVGHRAPAPAQARAGAALRTRAADRRDDQHGREPRADRPGPLEVLPGPTPPARTARGRRAARRRRGRSRRRCRRRGGG